MPNFIHDIIDKLKSEPTSGYICNTCQPVSGYIFYLLSMFSVLWKMFSGSNDNCSEGSFEYRCLAYLNTGIPFCYTGAECMHVMGKTIKYKIVLFIFHQLLFKKNSTEIFSTDDSPSRISLLYRYNLF